MNIKERKKILSIIKKLDKLKVELVDLVGTEQDDSKNIKAPESNNSEHIEKFVKNIVNLSTNEMEKELNEFNHKELGNIFVKVGGSGGEKRKPKAWLIERILWLSKEFIKGHKAIRDK